MFSFIKTLTITILYFFTHIFYKKTTYVELPNHLNSINTFRIEQNKSNFSILFSYLLQLLTILIIIHYHKCTQICKYMKMRRNNVHWTTSEVISEKSNETEQKELKKTLLLCLVYHHGLNLSEWNQKRKTSSQESQRKQQP